MKWHSYLCPIHFGQISETSRGCALWLYVDKQLVVRCTFSSVFSTHSSRANQSVCLPLPSSDKTPSVSAAPRIYLHDQTWLGKAHNPTDSSSFKFSRENLATQQIYYVGAFLSIYSATLLNNYFIPSHLYSYLQHSSFSFSALILLLGSPKKTRSNPKRTCTDSHHLVNHLTCICAHTCLLPCCNE